MNPPATETVLFTGDVASATLPEGTQREMKLSDLISDLAPNAPNTQEAILPDGAKCVLPIAGGMMLVHQTPPQVYGFRWIAEGSPAEFGPGTQYRDVRLALPYVIVIAVFTVSGRGAPSLSNVNECYFTNQPLETQGLDTPLFYPALLNCSVMKAGDGEPLSWICTQHLPRTGLKRARNLDVALRDGLGVLLRHLLESGFNRSSEHHEGASGFGATVEAKVDPRVASVEAWEEASRADPLFPLEVPWLPLGKTLREVAGRSRDTGRRSRRRIDTAADIVRLIFDATSPRRRKS